jgi:hypothetical protein
MTVVRLQSLARLVLSALFAAGTLLTATPAAACDICNLRLTPRSGPVAIVASKVPTAPGDVPHIRLLIVNRSRHAVTIGGPHGKPVLLYFATPNARGLEVVRGGWSRSPKPPERIAPGSRLSFVVAWLSRMNAAGLYRYNVGFDGAASNIVTYRVSHSHE